MGEIHARLETRVLRLDPNERQSHHRLCNRLLERLVVSCASPQLVRSHPFLQFCQCWWQRHASDSDSPGTARAEQRA
jgi:hypothetical protein